MAIPVQGTLDRIGQTVDKIAAALPVIRSTADSVSTVINGTPTRSAVQQPSAVQELVPRNVGGLNVGTAAGISTTMLVVGGLAVLLIFLSVRRR